MKKLYKFFKSLHYSLWLGLLTLCLVTVAVPVIATNVGEHPVISQVENQEANRLLTQGKTAYEAGRFTDAAEYWQQATQQYKDAHNIPSQALSSNYLALAHQELGNWKIATKNIDRSLQLLQGYNSQKRKTGNLAGISAQVMNTQGSLQLAMGKAELALDSWKQAEEYYRQEEDDLGLFGSRINQAQALQHLGLYRRSQNFYNSYNKKLLPNPIPH